MTDSWDPQQYQKFSKEREQPFFDLLEMIIPQPGMRVVDLGCGTGRLTKLLHERLQAAETVGLDASEAMLKESSSLATAHLRFERADIQTFSAKQPFDLVFSNAALQWLPDHPALFRKLSSLLTPNGQLAFQMPCFDALTHHVARSIEAEVPFVEALGEATLPHVLTPMDYSQLFYDLGFKQQRIQLKVYPYVLDSAEAVVEFALGTLLTHYKVHLSKTLFQSFLDIFRQRIHRHFGSTRPVFFPFSRLLIWAYEKCWG